MLRKQIEVLSVSWLEVWIPRPESRKGIGILRKIGGRISEVGTRDPHPIGCPEYCVRAEAVLRLDAGKRIDVSIVGRDRSNYELSFPVGVHYNIYRAERILRRFYPQ